MRINSIFVCLALVTMFLGVIACQPSPAPQENGTTSETTEAADAPEATTPAIPDEPVDNTTITPDDEGTTVVVDESGDTVVVTNTPDGTSTSVDPDTGTTVTVTAEIPEGWPEDVPLMDGFELIQSITGEDASFGENYTLVLGGSAPFEDIQTFYNGLEGWDKTTTGGMSPDGSEGIMMIFHRDTELLTISALKPEEGVAYDVVINLQYVKQ